MRMGMSFVGGGNEKDRIKTENENGGRTGMAEQEWWQNTGMADYSCSLNSSRDKLTALSKNYHWYVKIKNVATIISENL
jgi:hypothetical protein